MVDGLKPGPKYLARGQDYCLRMLPDHLMMVDGLKQNRRRRTGTATANFQTI